MDRSSVAGRAAFDLEKSLLDLEEIKASGEAPRDELYAPLVGGRDFVSERLEIDKKVLEADMDLRRARSSNASQGEGRPRPPPQERAGRCSRRHWRSRRRGSETSKNVLTLRRKFLAGEISAEEMEIQDRMTAAEKDLREARSAVDSRESALDDLRAKEAAGMISEDEVKGVQIGLDAAQAQAEPSPAGDRDPEDDQIGSGAATPRPRRSA